MPLLALQLYDYNVWANKQIFNRLNELPQNIYHKNIQSVFPSISNALAHIYLSDLGWLDVFSGKSMNHALRLAEQLKEQTEAKGIKEMEAMFAELAERYKIFLNKQENITKTLIIEHPSGDLMKTSVSELVPHVVNHGTYHRGNITAMLRQLGYSSVMTDYGFYLYLKQK
ncbi:damage-inducible protein DinB [Bacillus sp. Xin]|uniref:DinB family protein n=1 Tax=unclassified Bacillus (in: firmicutes) TaxID=185979 RepID=UPI0015725E2C|nr:MULTISPECIES: DinB family protein [unclassified Bacillus (in: firmicutes)]MBC6971354.1 damage-inducible protein DinB [Bacillus sp. Xin]NSW35843.1 damage-inducible protein DinB [Bacillus sp. Xin1]